MNSNDNDKEDDNYAYEDDGNAQSWFVGIVVAIALLAIGYLIYNSQLPV